MFTRSKRTRTKPMSRRLSVEALESRWMPYANVLASFSNGVLTLSSATMGGNEAVRLKMVGPKSDHLIALDDPSQSTLFNGFGTYQSPIGQKVTAIHINLKGGDDQVDVDAIDLVGGLTVNVGDGDNSVNVRNGTHVSSLKVTGGFGTDYFNLVNGVYVDKDLTLVAGAGTNTINAEFDVTVGGKLALTAGYGKDTVQLGHLHVVGNTTIALGAGENSLTNDDSDSAQTQFDGAFKATFGAESDTFALAPGTKFNAGLTAQLGGGVNTAILQGFDVAGSVNVAGGAGDDGIHLADLKVGGSLTVSLGAGYDLVALDDVSESNNIDPFNLIVSNVGSAIHGNLKVTSSGGGQRIEIGDEQAVHVFGTTAITLGGGGALIQIDDTTFDGAVAIKTAAGNDHIHLDIKSTLHGQTVFNAKLTLHAGTGNDVLRLGDSKTANSTVIFAVKPLLDGGADKDTLDASDYDYKGIGTPLGALSW